MNLKNAIFNADDLGMSAEIDRHILSAASCGFIQSASVSVVNGLNIERFKRFSKIRRSLKLGLHINLTEGRPFSPTLKTARFVNNQGLFKSALELLSDEKNLKHDLLFAEMDSQLKRFVQLSGQKPNHIDSHQHYTYLSPIAFRAFLNLAESENLKIRNPLPFINKNRLQFFIESVKRRYKVTIPFSSVERSLMLRDIFEASSVVVRTSDCLLEIPRKTNLNEQLCLSETIEIVSHPHYPKELEKLKLLQT